jgi:hypothetical protein
MHETAEPSLLVHDDEARRSLRFRLYYHVGRSCICLIIQEIQKMYERPSSAGLSLSQNSLVPFSTPYNPMLFGGFMNTNQNGNSPIHDSEPPKAHASEPPAGPVPPPPPSSKDPWRVRNNKAKAARIADERG